VAFEPPSYLGLTVPLTPKRKEDIHFETPFYPSFHHLANAEIVLVLIGQKNPAILRCPPTINYVLNLFVIASTLRK